MMSDNLEMNAAFCDVIKEVLEILNKVDKEFLEKIPEEIKETLIKYSKNSQKNIELDMTKKLSEQNISEECKDLLSIIYYICIDSSDEKRELIDCWNENSKKENLNG